MNRVRVRKNRLSGLLQEQQISVPLRNVLPVRSHSAINVKNLITCNHLHLYIVHLLTVYIQVFTLRNIFL